MAGSTSASTSSPAKNAAAAQDELVLVMDFGSQTAQLITRRVRDQNVFCQLVRHDLTADRIKALNPKGLILSGGPASVYGEGSRHADHVQHAGQSNSAGSFAGVWPITLYTVQHSGCGQSAVRRTSANLHRVDESRRSGRKPDR